MARRKHQVTGRYEEGFGYAFATVALHRGDGARMAAGGFFCLWEEELAFIPTKWIRLVMPLIGLPSFAPRPQGPDDRRTTVRVRYADISRVEPVRHWVVVRAGSGDYRFTGAGYNAAFGFGAVAEEIAAALRHAGYRVSVDEKELRVLGLDVGSGRDVGG